MPAFRGHSSRSPLRLWYDLRALRETKSGKIHFTRRAQRQYRRRKKEPAAPANPFLLDHRLQAQARSGAMFFSLLVPRRIYRHIPILILFLIAAGLLVCFSPFRSNSRAQAPAYEKELSAGGKALLTIKNRNGRVSVVAS